MTAECPPSLPVKSFLLAPTLRASRGLCLPLAPFHPFELHAIGIEEEHGVVIVVILAGRIDDLHALLFQERLQSIDVLPAPELEGIMMEADASDAIFALPLLRIGRADPQPRLAVRPADGSFEFI